MLLLLRRRQKRGGQERPHWFPPRPPPRGRSVEGRACETQGSIFSGIFVRFSIFLGVKFWQKFPEKKVMRCYSRHLPSPTATSSHLKFQEFRRKGLSQLSSCFLACSCRARLRSEHATVVSDASDRLEKSLHLHLQYVVTRAKGNRVLPFGFDADASMLLK